jgi:hypothetical protein
MKLRLLGNSVRLRLSRSEVETLAETGLIEETVDLVPNPLVYMIHASKDCRNIQVSFLNGWITITAPEHTVNAWASGPDVGITGSHRNVAVLIEKDWNCLHATEAENEDTFPRS